MTQELPETCPYAGTPAHAWRRRSRRTTRPVAARRTSSVTRFSAVEKVKTSTRIEAVANATAICSAVCACRPIERLPSMRSTNLGERLGRRNHRPSAARRRSAGWPSRFVAIEPPASRRGPEPPSEAEMRRRTRARAASRHGGIWDRQFRCATRGFHFHGAIVGAAWWPVPSRGPTPARASRSACVGEPFNV